jgi:hypothetical protein
LNQQFKRNAAARRLQNAAELIGVVLAWLLALCPNLICNSFGKTNRVLILSLTVESLTFYKTGSLIMQLESLIFHSKFEVCPYHALWSKIKSDTLHSYSLIELN